MGILSNSLWKMGFSCLNLGALPETGTYTVVFFYYKNMEKCEKVGISNSVKSNYLRNVTKISLNIDFYIKPVLMRLPVLSDTISLFQYKVISGRSYSIYEYFITSLIKQMYFIFTDMITVR